jgi:hypothetical protein
MREIVLCGIWLSRRMIEMRPFDFRHLLVDAATCSFCDMTLPGTLIAHIFFENGDGRDRDETSARGVRVTWRVRVVAGARRGGCASWREHVAGGARRRGCASRGVRVVGGARRGGSTSQGERVVEGARRGGCASRGVHVVGGARRDGRCALRCECGGECARGGRGEFAGGKGPRRVRMWLWLQSVRCEHEKESSWPFAGHVSQASRRTWVLASTKACPGPGTLPVRDPSRSL